MFYSQLLSENPQLSKEEFEKVFADYLDERSIGVEEGEAFNTLVVSNIRLVIWVVKKMGVLTADFGDDIIQEGIVGVIKALKMYEPDKGAFSGYAMFWIKQSIMRYFEKQFNPIRIPAHLTSKLRKYQKDVSELEVRLGHEPSDEEIVEHLSVTSGWVKDVEYLSTLNNQSSLDAPLDVSEGKVTLGELIPSRGIEQEGYLKSEALGDVVEELFAELSDKEEKILMLRFGFIDGRVWKFSEIAPVLSTSPTYAQYLYGRALRKLGKSSLKVKVFRMMKESGLTLD